MCSRAVASSRRGRGQAGMAHARSALLVALSLSGCGPVERFYDSKFTPDTPIDWWHGLQGGRIAEVRPPPPGVADPYPSLASVPARPVLPDAATRRALAAQLIAERDRTRRDNERDPILTVAAPAPTSAPAAPSRPAPTPDPEASVAVLEAATAPPAPAQPAPAAPVEPARPAPPAAAPAGVLRSAIESGPMPDLPTAAPDFPQLRGLPATAYAPATPRPLPSVSISFARGSAALSDNVDAALRDLAQRRAGGPILISVGGDALSSAPDAQASALPLALRRARTVAAELTGAGVPASALRYDVAAMGRRAGAFLIEP